MHENTVGDWLARVIASRNTGGNVEEGGRPSSPELADKKESVSGVSTEVEEVLSGEPEANGNDGASQGRRGEENSQYGGDSQQSTVRNRGDMDAGSGTIGGNGSAAGYTQGSPLAWIRVERMRLESLIEWVSNNREKWGKDPSKADAFRARENFILSSLEKIEKVEERYREEYGLSAAAMGRLIELYNLPQE